MSEIKELFGFPVMLDESVPADNFQFRHADGRIDSFMLVSGEVVPVNLTKLDDPPNWSCPVCAFVNENNAPACACCGLTDK